MFIFSKDQHPFFKNRSSMFMGLCGIALAFLLANGPRDVAAQPALDGASTGADTIINVPFVGAIENVIMTDGAVAGEMQIIGGGGALDFPNPTNTLTINLADNPQNFFLYTTFDAAFNPVGGITINGGANTDNISADSIAFPFTPIPHTLNGNDGADILTGSPFNDTINGGNANDLINGGTGDDTIDAGPGDDQVTVGFPTTFPGGGNGNDIIDGGTGSEILGDTLQVFGDPGNPDNFGVFPNATRFDVARINAPASFLDTGTIEHLRIDGNGGNDMMFIDDLTGVLNLNSILLEGGGNNDILDATPLPDLGLDITLDGGVGMDQLIGSQGPDTLLGGDGNDTIQGNRGADIIDGGAQNDTSTWNNGDGSDIIDGGTGIADRQIVNGADGAGDEFDVSPNGARATFSRTNLGLFSLDIGTIETLEVNGLAGNDIIVVNDLSGVSDLTSVEVNGGDDDDTVRADHSTNTSVTADGGDPAVPTGDIFQYLGGGTIPGTAPNGTYTEGGFQNIDASNFETLFAPPNMTGAFRVDPVDGDDDNNGASFTNDGPGVGPKRTIQHAIDCAADGGDDVWLRQGTYKTSGTRTVDCDDMVGAVTDVAIVMASDVCVIGGFDGTETSADEKSDDPKLTIIDGSCAVGGTTPANHVVAFVAVTSASLECLTVQGGIADDVDGVNNIGGGIYIRCADETNHIFGTVVQCNEALLFGAGVGYHGPVAPANVEIEQSIIVGNTLPGSGGGGGGIGLSGSNTDPYIHESFISGNFAEVGGGIGIANGAAALFINDVISGNGALAGGGVAAFGEAALTMYHCDINHNAAEGGGGVALASAAVGAVIRNSTIVSNMPNGIHEFDISDADEISFNLFFDNMGADYIDSVAGSLAGAAAINGTLGNAFLNVDGDPLFIMDGPDAITGTAEAVLNNPTSCTITLVDAEATLTPGELRCQLLMMRGFSKRQYLIIDNTETEIVVLWCKTPNAQTPFITTSDPYVVVNYDLRLGSGAIDLASSMPGPAIDILLRSRPVDITGQGAGARRNGPGPMTSIFDIGAYEARGVPLFVELTSLSATSNGASTTIAWETSAEVDNVGFNVYRSDADGNTGKQVNGFIIPAEGSETEGASYSITDNAGASHYVLEDIDLNGTRTIHGPVAVLVSGASGDVNGDGSVNQIDAILLYRSVVNGDDVGDEGDFNGDGVVNVLDAIALYRSTVGAE